MTQSMKVLVIEDRRDNIVFIANKILKPKGFEIITARDGELGLQKAVDEQPDLIISDVKLPKMSGLDVLEELRKRRINTPAIVMTFHGSEETAIRAFRLGAKDYLIKPFGVEEMLAAVDRALQPADDDGALARAKGEWETERARLLAQLAQQGAALEGLQARQDGERARTLDMAELAQRAATWEEESARLNALLAQQGEALDEARSQMAAMTKVASTQRQELERHRIEAERLARELHSVAGAIHMLAQSLGEQAGHLGIVAPEQNLR
jgi:DNA-binding response OmpR family regulator